MSADHLARAYDDRMSVLLEPAAAKAEWVPVCVLVINHELECLESFVERLRDWHSGGTSTQTEATSL